MARRYAGILQFLPATYVSANLLTVRVPAELVAAVGTIRISVTNPNGDSVWTLYRITTPPPLLTSINPSTKSAKTAAFPLELNGRRSMEGASVFWDEYLLATKWVSSTQLTATVAPVLAALPGRHTIQVRNPDEQVSGKLTFVITEAAPIITGVSPGSVTAGGSAFTLTVNGTGLPSSAVVRWGTTSLTTTYLSGVKLNAAVPSSLIAQAGTFALTVAGASGAVSEGWPVTVEPREFRISGISPAAVVAGSPAFNLLVRGTGFATGAEVRWNGTALSATPAGDSELRAAVSASLVASPGSAFETAAGTAVLEVLSNGVRSAPVEFLVTRTAPGVMFFQNNHTLAINHADGSINSGDHPAKPGQYIVVYLTGLGQVDNPVGTGAAAPASPLSRPLARVDARIAGQTAKIGFAGLTPGYAGLAHINLEIPDVPAGEQPLEIVNGVAANQTVVTIQGQP